MHTFKNNYAIKNMAIKNNLKHDYVLYQQGIFSYQIL